MCLVKWPFALRSTVDYERAEKEAQRRSAGRAWALIEMVRNRTGPSPRECELIAESLALEVRYALEECGFVRMYGQETPVSVMQAWREVTKLRSRFNPDDETIYPEASRLVDELRKEVAALKAQPRLAKKRPSKKRGAR